MLINLKKVILKSERELYFNVLGKLFFFYYLK
jgi:hypothetical protein